MSLSLCWLIQTDGAAPQLSPGKLLFGPTALRAPWSPLVAGPLVAGLLVAGPLAARGGDELR